MGVAKVGRFRPGGHGDGDVGFARQAPAAGDGNDLKERRGSFLSERGRESLTARNNLSP